MFVKNGFDDVNIFCKLTDEILKEIGVSKIGHRLKLLEEIKQYQKLSTNIINFDDWISKTTQIKEDTKVKNTTQSKKKDDKENDDKDVVDVNWFHCKTLSLAVIWIFQIQFLSFRNEKKHQH